LETELRKKVQQLEESIDKIFKMELNILSLVDEREKMVVRINKLKMKKRRSDIYYQSTKICQNCKRDFKDTENFNWSCRTH